MPANPSPAPALPPEGANVDSLSETTPPAKKPTAAGPTLPPEQVSHAKKLLLLGGGVFYALFVLWSLFLVAVLPSNSSELQPFVPLGMLSSLVAAAVFLGAGVLGFQRIAKADISVASRKRSLIKLLIAVIPGVILAIVVPILISREPGLEIAIDYPTRSEDFVAPLAVTLTAEPAMQVLRELGLRPVPPYRWDFDGDGEPNDETVAPTSTVLLERQGSYLITMTVKMDDGSTRRLSRRVLIPRAVFSVTPLPPIVEQPVRFSVAHLLPDPKQLKEVQWDFDGDGTVDEVTKEPDTIRTFYSTGRVQVTAVLQLLNQTQKTYQRVLEVTEPQEPPFPITFSSEPKNLVGPSPFGAIFWIDTEEPLKEVWWLFGDDKDERGADLRRIGHNYEKPGIYTVQVKVRSGSGELAEMTMPVRVTEPLNLPDLRFEGTPDVRNDVIRGEVPLTVDLRAKTNVPLVEFSWEAPNATSSTLDGDHVTAVYRSVGTYTLTLLAQDPERKSMRMPLTVEVVSAAAEPVIDMKPEGGTAPLRVLFDASRSFIPPGRKLAGFKWLFGDETGAREGELTGARTEHLYLKPGQYTVTLTAVMETGEEYESQRVIVVREPLLDACIEATRTRTQVGKGIEFDSRCSTGKLESYLWSVRLDSDPDVIQGESPEPTYIHVFEREGDYTISLTITDTAGRRDTTTLSVTVTP